MSNNRAGSSAAQAEVPNSGPQRQEMVDTLKAIDDKVDRLDSFLESGKLQVHVAAPDDTNKDAKTDAGN